MVRKAAGGSEASTAAPAAATRSAPRARARAASLAAATALKSPGPPVRVAVVGGGCAGLAAAWELSRCPGYDVQVYERAFRLGGKGASGRDDDGRIREHGLHVWLGFYENAFGLMRECYAEVAAQGWGPRNQDPRARLAHASMEEAFLAEAHIGVGGVDAQGKFNVWSGVLPPAKGMPGEPLDAQSNPYSLASYMLRSLEMVKALVQSTVAPPSQGWTRSAQRNEPADIEELVARISGTLCGGALSGIAGMLNAMTLIEQWIRRLDDSRKRSGTVLKVLVALASQMRKTLSDMVGIDDKLRWKTELVDIVLAIAVGLMRDRLLFHRQGFDAINDLDYRAWLARHGATRAALKSRFITGIYELVFAYEDGDAARPAFAAGVALRSALRMFFTYRGAMFWRLRSGMGDAVFAPLYRSMLKPCAQPGKTPRSPVRFHFLHTLHRIRIGRGADGRQYVQRLEFATQGNAKLTSSTEPVALDDFGCWPMRDSRLRQETDTPGTRTLDFAKDFDAVILAMGVDDFIKLLRADDPNGAGLFKKLPERWSRMAEDKRTVATQAAQVWFAADFKSMGWNARPSIVTALDMPYETWADMTHTLASERAWREASGKTFPDAIVTARSVAYFCSALPDRPRPDSDQAEADDLDAKGRAEKSLMHMLEKDARSLWPNAYHDGMTPIDLIAPPKQGVHVQTNTEGSERYTLSTPGSIASRISPLDQTFGNMTIAGDWTACGLDAGCVEAAVMSGKLAAHAITGSSPPLESIIGYDHP